MIDSYTGCHGETRCPGTLSQLKQTGGIRRGKVEIEPGVWVK